MVKFYAKVGLRPALAGAGRRTFIPVRFAASVVCCSSWEMPVSAWLIPRRRYPHPSLPMLRRMYLIPLDLRQGASRIYLILKNLFTVILESATYGGLSRWFVVEAFFRRLSPNLADGLQHSGFRRNPAQWAVTDFAFEFRRLQSRPAGQGLTDMEISGPGSSLPSSPMSQFE